MTNFTLHILENTAQIWHAGDLVKCCNKNDCRYLTTVNRWICSSGRVLSSKACEPVIALKEFQFGVHESSVSGCNNRCFWLIPKWTFTVWPYTQGGACMGITLIIIYFYLRSWTTNYTSHVPSNIRKLAGSTTFLWSRSLKYWADKKCQRQSQERTVDFCIVREIFSWKYHFYHKESSKEGDIPH